MTDFDQIYKRLIKNFFQWFLEFFCKEIAREIDFRVKPEFIDKELYTDQVHGKRRHVDILARVRLLAGKWQYILIHIEIQREWQKGFSLRMFNYYKAVTIEYKERLFAIAIDISEENRQKRLPDHFEENCFGTRVRYEYEVRRLKDYDYEKYLEYDNPLVSAFLVYMRHHKYSKGIVKIKALEKLSRYKLTEKERAIIIDFIERIIRLNKEEEIEFKEHLNRDTYKEVREMVTGYMEMVEEYKAEGKVEGKAEGRIEGERLLLMRLIERKWGKISPEIREQLDKINSIEELETLGEKVIDCERLEDLFLP